jgi:hypothetical protein
MTASTNLILYPHCPKTAGTTLKQRYRYDNKEFCVYDDEHDNDDFINNTKVIFGHGVEINLWEDTFPDRNIIYITCLRDPIERMMSMYNFFKTQLFHINKNSLDVDFYLWYTNKDVIRPMPAVKQYEYYLQQSDCYSQSHLVDYDLYNNTILTWDVEADATSINKDRVSQLQMIKDRAEEHNMELTWNNVMQRFDHVLFQDTDIVKEFDNLLNHYDMNMEPWRDMTITNETSYDLNKQGYNYIRFGDLKTNLQELVLEDLKYDIEFYIRCVDKWKR